MIEVLKQMVEALELSAITVDNFEVQKKTQEAIKAGKQAIAELESQEPVQTIEDLEQEIYQNTRNFVSLNVMEWMLKRYYTHPPQRTWVGLTDDEMYKLWLSADEQKDRMALGKAIEAKLKEKNT